MKHSTIEPHLRGLDELVYDNCTSIRNKKSSRYVTVSYANQKCAVILGKQQLHSDLADFLHAACFAPVKSTFLKAIKKASLKPGQDYPKNL